MLKIEEEEKRLIDYINDVEHINAVQLLEAIDRRNLKADVVTEFIRTEDEISKNSTITQTIRWLREVYELIQTCDKYSQYIEDTYFDNDVLDETSLEMKLYRACGEIFSIIQ